jgi:hypothetical protein
METFAKATWAFQSEDEGMLSFPEGAVIKLINFNQGVSTDTVVSDAVTTNRAKIFSFCVPFSAP